MQVIAIASGIDDRGHRKEVGDIFSCPKNPEKQEIVKASWYREHKPEEDKGAKKSDGKNLV